MLRGDIWCVLILSRIWLPCIPCISLINLILCFYFPMSQWCGRTECPRRKFVLHIRRIEANVCSEMYSLISKPKKVLPIPKFNCCAPGGLKKSYNSFLEAKREESLYGLLEHNIGTITNVYWTFTGWDDWVQLALHNLIHSSLWPYQIDTINVPIIKWENWWSRGSSTRPKSHD